MCWCSAATRSAEIREVIGKVGEEEEVLVLSKAEVRVLLSRLLG